MLTKNVLNAMDSMRCYRHHHLHDKDDHLSAYLNTISRTLSQVIITMT